MKTLVMKFGGAAVSSLAHFDKVAQIVSHRRKTYRRIIVVVSAMANMTDELFALARSIHGNPPKRELDLLVSVGERVSMSLLAMALDKIQIPALSFTGSQSGIITDDQHAEAKIVNIRPVRLQKHLEEGKIVIVAGFQGVSTAGEVTTLGRGGGDTSAVALGIAFSAEKVEFYKDVAGMYAEDPKDNPDAVFYQNLSYAQAMQILERGAKILHIRALKLAAQNQMPLTVKSFKLNNRGTEISDKQINRPLPTFEVSVE